MNSPLNGHNARSLATQNTLMRAVEKLVAKKGIGNVSIREILDESGQKNESALQYHFKNMAGLIRAVHKSRSAETRKIRGELLDELLSLKSEPTLRDLCYLVVGPPFMLAKANVGYRNYLIAFSQQLIIAEDSVSSTVGKGGGGGDSGRRTNKLLRSQLSHLHEIAYKQRMNVALLLCSISITRHAKQKNAFRGKASQLFLNNLLDAVVAILIAPVSPETRAIEKQLGI